MFSVSPLMQTWQVAGALALGVWAMQQVRDMVDVTTREADEGLFLAFGPKRTVAGGAMT